MAFKQRPIRQQIPRYVLIGFTQLPDKLLFVGLMESNTFPRGEGAPKGRMRNGET